MNKATGSDSEFLRKASKGGSDPAKISPDYKNEGHCKVAHKKRTVPAERAG